MGASALQWDYHKDKEVKLFSIRDIMALPEGKRAELINGEIYEMAPPSYRHQLIIGIMLRELGAHIKEKGGTCKVLPAPFGVYLYNDDINYMEPDISVVCDESKLDEKGCHGAPDIILEIVSPSSKTMDYMRKLLEYYNAGVKEYWIIDPMKQSSTVYLFPQDKSEESVEIYEFSDYAKSRIFPGFSIKLSEFL